ANKTKAVVEALLGIESLRAFADVPLPAFLDDLLNDPDEVADLALSVSEQQLLRERLVRFLSVPSVLIGGKAAGVLTSHQNSFGGCRIFTDIRPVFADTEQEVAAQAAVLV